MTITQLLVDLKYGEDLLDSILSGDKDGDSNDKSVEVVNDRGRDNVSTSDGRDIEEYASC